MLIIKKDSPVDMDEIALEQLKIFLESNESFWQVEAFFNKESFAIKAITLAPKGYAGTYRYASKVYKVTITQNGN